MFIIIVIIINTTSPIQTHITSVNFKNEQISGIDLRDLTTVNWRESYLQNVSLRVSTEHAAVAVYPWSSKPLQSHFCLSLATFFTKISREVAT
jgi:hypothetical protein